MAVLVFPFPTVLSKLKCVLLSSSKPSLDTVPAVFRVHSCSSSFTLIIVNFRGQIYIQLPC